MKNITLLVIGGISTVLFAPVISWLLVCLGTFLMMAGKALSTFPGIF